MRWVDTLWVLAACLLFTLVFSAVVGFSLRENFEESFEAPREAIFIYSAWSDRAENLAQVRQAGATLVSSNPSDTAWLVNVPSAKIGQSILAGNAMAAFKPSELAIVVAGCGAVVVDTDGSQAHASADNSPN